MAEIHHPRHLSLNALTYHNDDPTEAVQYCIVGANGRRYVYGDQEWVASGAAIEDSHPGGHVEKRTISITYGEWSPIPSESRSNP